MTAGGGDERRRRRARLLAAAALLVTLVLHLCGFDDELRGEPWRESDTASIARNFLDEPDLLRPRILWGAPGPGYVETELQLYPFAVHLLYRVFGPHVVLGKLVSLLLTGLAAVALWRIARSLLPEAAALVALVAFTTSYLLFRYGAAFMPDPTALAAYLFAAERFLAHVRTGRNGPLWAAGALLAVAILVKPTTIHLGLWCALVVFARGGLRAVFAPRMLAFGAIALLPALAFYPYAATLHERFGNTFGSISGGDSKWGGPAYWLDARFWARIVTVDAFLGLGAGGCVLLAFGVVLRHPRRLWRVVAPWFVAILAYYLIVARYALIARHYHLFVLAPGALGVGAGWHALGTLLRWHGFTRPRTATVLALPLALLLVQHWGASARLVLRREDLVTRAAGERLGELSSPGDLVVVTGDSPRDDQGVTNNYEDPRVLFAAWRRGVVVPSDELTAPALREALAIGARWLVVLDSALPHAAPGFVDAAARLPEVARGDGFTIRRAAP